MTKIQIDLMALETYVADRLESFMTRFCLGAGMDLYTIAFSSERVHIYYVLECGQHVHNNVPFEEFNLWMSETK